MNKDLTFWIERKPFVKASKRRYRLWILHNVFPCICDKHKRCSALKVSRKVTAINFSRKNEKISQKPNNEVHDTCFASVYLTLCCQSRRSTVKGMALTFKWMQMQICTFAFILPVSKLTVLPKLDFHVFTKSHKCYFANDTRKFYKYYLLLKLSKGMPLLFVRAVKTKLISG